MKKTYMTPAISVMAMETAAILADSNKMNAVFDRRPTSDNPTDNQFSKEHTFDAWED